MNRIWILGGTNSGKTTFAKKISKKLRLRYYATDFMKYNKDFSKKLSEKLRDKKIKELARKKKWVCEGTNRAEWVWPAFKKSDFVIILKTSPFIRIKRLFNREINERKRKLSIGKKIRLWYIVFSYHFKGYRHHKDLAKQFNKPYIVLRNNKEMDKFLEELK